MGQKPTPLAILVFSEPLNEAGRMGGLKSVTHRERSV